MICAYFLLAFVALLGGGHGAVVWEFTPDGGLVQVSVGRSGVWGVNANNVVYYRENTYNNQGALGSDWISVTNTSDHLFTQVDVGRDVVWGVTVDDEVYVRLGISESNPIGTEWAKVEGSLIHVSVSDNGHVWGVSRARKIYYREGAGYGGSLLGYSWTNVKGSLKQISVGQAGVWGVNDQNRIYYRNGTYNDNGAIGNDWLAVGASFSRLKYVSSGLGIVIGVNANNAVYRRSYISAVQTKGTNWELLADQTLVNVDGFEYNTFWGVMTSSQNPQGRIFRGYDSAP